MKLNWFCSTVFMCPVLMASVALADVPFVAGFDRFHSLEATVDGGRLLLTELSCTACHVSAGSTLEPKRGPALKGAGLRLQKPWLRRFLNSPQAAKPGATMPDLLHGLKRGEKLEAIEALVAYLSTQQAPFPDVLSTASRPVAFEFWRKGNPQHGRELFHRIGCVVCHEADKEYSPQTLQVSQLEKQLAQLEPSELEEMGLSGVARPANSVPLGDLLNKYTRRSLAFFLLNPGLTRPAGRMPDPGLTHAEASDITEYLLQKQAESVRIQVAVPSAELISKGRTLFRKFRCSNCHTVGEEVNSTPAGALAALNFDSDRACFRQAGSGQPGYSLSDLQGTALVLAARAVAAQNQQPELAAEFQMMQLNCFACHQRSRRGGIGLKRRRYFETEGGVDFGDEGRLPPPLDHAGRKLSEKWLLQVMAGQAAVRPYMQIRMPGFAAHAEKLVANLKHADDTKQSDSERAVFGDLKGLTAAGRELLNTGCIQCHPLRGEQLPGVIGIDLDGTASRIAPGWFREFLLNPGALKPGTRMPTFFPNGRSSNQEVLGGNVDRQIAAIWTYLKQVKSQQLPPRILAGKEHNFELTPKDKPVVLRTFMKRVGLQAIAVGFPQQVHVAFDSRHSILGQAWRGRFLDAHGTWFDRFTPFAEPLGSDVVIFDRAIPFASQNSFQPWPTLEQSGYQFRGYRLDQSGVPTFLYRFGSINVEDRFEPAGDRSLQRRFTLSDQRQAGRRKLWFRPHSGKSLKTDMPFAYTDEAGLTVTVTDAIRDMGRLRSIEAGDEWLIPFTLNGQITIEVSYKW